MRLEKTQIASRLSGLGGAKWEIYLNARELIEKGQDIIDLTIGEPDVPTPPRMIKSATLAMQRGRTKYAAGRGEPGLRAALARRYSACLGREILAQQILCLPGTQTALYAVMLGVAEKGCEVLVGDPMYATYEGVIAASGAQMVPVPLRSELGFAMDAGDIAARVRPKTTAILLTTPHNPTGAILNPSQIEAIGRVAIAHDLWIISDEVYEDLVFPQEQFVSPLAQPALADRVIIVSSISKSHAAPGFRSGWCIGPQDFIEDLLPVCETMLFGNQPFIADMTEEAIRNGSEVAEGMRQRYAARARVLAECLEQQSDLRVHPPKAGMFAMVDVTATGMDGQTYALDLLQNAKVAVMPGTSFGATLRNWVRIALTVRDDIFYDACARLIEHRSRMKGNAR